GFYEIARVDGQVVFMENRRTGFADYLAHLQAESAAAIAALSKLPTHPSSVGAVILNANPFTLGHQYLLETAAAACDLLHVFVVSEDVSLFPFSVRSQLVEKGSAHLKNVLYHQTGNYMISNATFPSYFLKDSDIVIRSHAKLDIEVFKQIARSLGITDRFIGEEPFSQVTGIYNQVMEEELA
ncbi:MAG: adenylyltransferase/cytidyltransferase family protein, partial [Hungatella sp.]